MRKILFSLVLVLSIVPITNTLAVSLNEDGSKIDQIPTTKESKETKITKHNWRKTSSELEMVHADTHEYTAWHNFVKRTRKCDITHKIRTEVWYCDLHNHTKSDISLEETIHSRNHSD